MKNFIYKTGLLFLLTLFLAITQISCSDDDNSTGSNEPVGESGQDPALVGTWKLTKILAPLATTPEAVGLELLASFSANATLQFTTTDADGTAIDEGSWSTADGNLTITIEGEDPATSPYTVVGNIATISAFPVDFQGTVVLASLEFTKQ